VAEPTFESIADYAGAMKAPVVKVPLRPNFAHDLEAMLARAEGAGLVYICNPNNPTASLTPRADIEAFLRQLPKDTYVLIDEAYHHFAASAEYASFIDRPVDDPRVMVARTFSKVYGLAGLRIGYAVAQPQTIQRLQPYQLEDNINMVGARCAMAGLRDDAGLKEAEQRILADRAEFMRQATNRKLRVIPSYANFLMMETGRPVRSLIAHFNSQGVRVGRPFARMENYLRVSLGRPEEMAAFWSAWDMLPPAQG
jgi:histidinol-phosphate aminotransferase